MPYSRLVMVKRKDRPKPKKSSAHSTLAELEAVMDLAAETAETCRSDIERVLNVMAASSPHRLILESIHDRLRAVVVTLSAERRAPTIDLDAVDCTASRARKVLAGVVTVAGLLGATAEVSGFSARDLAESLTTSATVADECFAELQVSVLLMTANDDLGYAELRELVGRARLLAQARLRELEWENPSASMQSNLDRVLLGYRRDVEVRPSYVRAHLAETLDRIKSFEEMLGISKELQARAAIDHALNRPGPTAHMTALIAALDDLAERLS